MASGRRGGSPGHVRTHPVTGLGWVQGQDRSPGWRGPSGGLGSEAARAAPSFKDSCRLRFLQSCFYFLCFDRRCENYAKGQQSEWQWGPAEQGARFSQLRRKRQCGQKGRRDLGANKRPLLPLRTGESQGSLASVQGHVCSQVRAQFWCPLSGCRWRERIT